MSGKTNELINFQKKFLKNLIKENLMFFLSSGEQVTCALLAGALIKLKLKLNLG